jgi:hypothetical protein
VSHNPARPQPDNCHHCSFTHVSCCCLHHKLQQEYAVLKAQLLDNTRKSGGAIGAYLLLTVNGQAALLAMLGAGASYAYLLWLCRDVDAVQGTDLVPIWEANKVCFVWEVYLCDGLCVCVC